MGKAAINLEKDTNTTGLLQSAEHIVLISLFCLILLGFFVCNFKALNKSFVDEWKKEVSVQQRLLQTEKSFQERIYKRKDFINLYGAALKTMNLRVVGDFDFVKDTQGVIQRFGTRTDTTTFLKNMEALKETTDEVGTPLVYISLPDKGKYLEIARSDQFCIEGRMSSQIGKLLGNTVDCIDIDALLSTDRTAPPFGEFYFHTDVHCSTYGEFWMAKALTYHLQDRYLVDFPNAQQVFDLEQYSITGYEFVGNTARSAGEYFAGEDWFEIYRPKFETDLKLINPSMSEQRLGPFDVVMLNGYESKPSIDKYTYWVTNYGRFTSPYYQYINKQADNSSPKILLISDSIFMRGASYLALACKELTVLDPRYFKGTEYVAHILSLEHYDAVVVVATSSNFYNISFSSRLETPNLPTKSMISQEGYGEWIANQGICLDTCNDNRVGGKTDIQIEKDAFSVKLYGWAADFCNGAPFQELYLRIGDIITKCEYGIERTSVVDHFKKDSLLKTGFRVEFPIAYLQDAKETEIAFVGVSADGQYLYEPVKYRLYSS